MDRVDQQLKPSWGFTLGRTLDLAQRVATDELRLLQLDSQDRVSEALRRGMWIAFGALCLAAAWVVVCVAVVVALEEQFPLEQRLAVLAASQFLLGAALVWFGLRGHRAAR